MCPPWRNSTTVWRLQQQVHTTFDDALSRRMFNTVKTMVKKRSDGANRVPDIDPNWSIERQTSGQRVRENPAAMIKPAPALAVPAKESAH